MNLKTFSEERFEKRMREQIGGKDDGQQIDKNALPDPHLLLLTSGIYIRFSCF